MKNRKKPGLTTKIFIGLLAGAATGILLHYAVPAGAIRDEFLIGGIFYVVGNGFLRLMQMLVVPLVFRVSGPASVCAGGRRPAREARRPHFVRRRASKPARALRTLRRPPHQWG